MLIFSGSTLIQKRTKTDIEASIPNFERAIELDPNYAPASCESRPGLVPADGKAGQPMELSPSKSRSERRCHTLRRRLNSTRNLLKHMA